VSDVSPAHPPPLDTRSRLVIVTTCLGAFAGQVDASIVQLGLPALEKTFDSRLHDVSWVAIAYSVAFAAALPVFARLAETGRRKAMYVAGFALFGLFSALCGFAQTLGALIALRVLQGVSGALLGANSVVILVGAAGPARRGRAMGLFAAAQAVGISAGPVLGGILLDRLSWHWMFWMTVPVAVLATALGIAVVPPSKPGDAGRGLDWAGAAALVPGLALLQLTVTKLQAWGPLSPLTLASAAAVGALLVLFLRRESRAAHPLVDLSVFRSPAFAGGVAGVFLSYAILYGLFFAMSFALVRGYGIGPLTAGLRLAAVPVALGLVAPLAGRWAETDARTVLLAGAGVSVAALLALSRILPLGPGSEPALLAALALAGAGLGLFIAPNNSATLGAAPPDHAGQAGGLLNLMRALGTASGVSAASAVLSWRLSPPGGPAMRTDAVPGALVLDAAGDVMLLLALFALAAGLASRLRARPAA
jgi:EmrB/QacA subfamily drug resistance transporter